MHFRPPILLLQHPLRPPLGLHLPNPLIHLPHLPDLRIQQAIPRFSLPRADRPGRKQHLNLLNRLPRRLGVTHKRLHGSPDTQHPENDKQLPGDVLKSGGDEEADGEIEEPVRYAGEGHPCRAGFQGPDFGGVDPGYGGEGEGVGEHEDVAEGDDGVGGGAGDLDFDAEVAVKAVGEGGA